MEALDARAARRWAVAALSALGEAREEIDALNVYPVPDGDTGTNLYLTVEAACAAVQALSQDTGLRDVAETFARGALLGARGNSGVIAAQLLRGWADVLGERGVLDASAAREAFARADAGAWQAVGRPVEGTILSVSRAAAEAAATAGGRLGEVTSAAVAAAEEALGRTPQQLEALRRAGVVDAGGRGLVVLLQSLDDLVADRSRPPLPRRRRHPSLPSVDLTQCRDLRTDGPAYEVMYLLDAVEPAVEALRERLAPMGESLVVVGGGALWNVHVHVDDPGAAVEAGLQAGRPHRVRITHFAEQVARSRDDRSRRDRVGLVACAAGPGLARLFAAAGAVVVEGSPGRRPSTVQILDAVRRADATSVVVLPNDADTLAVARAAASSARQDGIRVTVLPTRAQVHGLAAAAVHDPARAPDDDVVAMTSAAGGTRDGAVTVAARDAITSAGVCREGDALGVVDGDFAIVGRRLADVAVQVVDRLLWGGGELVTVVVGRDADPALVAAVTEHLRGVRRDVEVNVLEGGQPRYPLLLGVE